MSAVAKAENLLKQLLFGLETALSQITSEFGKIVIEKYEKMMDLNDKKIQLQCSEIQRRMEVRIFI